jgi:hypothetical protein
MPVKLNSSGGGSVTLDVPVTASTFTATIPAVTGTLVTDAGGSTVQFGAGSASAPSITTTGDTNTGMFFPAADQIAFAEGGTEVMRIDASGDVGIGTSSPAGKVGVERASGSAGWAYHFKATGVENDSGFFMTASNNTEMVLRDSSANLSLITNSGNNLSFFTADTERARITSTGRLQFATTAFDSGVFNISGYTDGGLYGVVMRPTANTSSPFQFQNAAGTEVGTITAGTATTSYNTSSDYRLKHDVQPLTGGLATIAALKPSTYKWNADNSHGEGFIAHELAEHIPHAVTGEKDAVNEDGSIKPQGVDYSKIVVHLVAAVQELKAENDTLKARIATLEAR